MATASPCLQQLLKDSQTFLTLHPVFPQSGLKHCSTNQKEIVCCLHPAADRNNKCNLVQILSPVNAAIPQTEVNSTLSLRCLYIIHMGCLKSVFKPKRTTNCKGKIFQSLINLMSKACLAGFQQ